MKQIKVLLAEDHTIVREGVRKMLEIEKDFKVVGEASDGRKAVLLAAKLHPNVVLMDIAMPLLNGLEAARQLLKTVPTHQSNMLYANSDDAYVDKAIESSAMGFLLKQTSVHDLCRANRQVQNGKTFFSPRIRRGRDNLSSETPGRRHVSNRMATPLTSREKGVLQLIAEGNANKQKAVELGIGINNVEKHREHLMKNSTSKTLLGLPVTPSTQASLKVA